MSRPAPDSGILRHWYWMWLVSALFVAAIAYFFFFRYPVWYRNGFRAVSLAHEMNYAVWWSGICLFMAGLVFATVGSLERVRGGRAWIWYVMALAMLALCIDEVGSLHEMVSRVSGWWGLAPFALVFAVVFGIAFVHVARNPGTRVVAFLIFLSFAIFVGVAGLEHLEHLETFRHHFWRRLRQVGEEGIELVAMGLLITAGLMAMRRMGDPDRRFMNATRVVREMVTWPIAMFGLFVAQVAVISVVILPNHSYFPEGVIAAVYPMLMFFCLGILLRQLAAQGHRGIYNWMAFLFFLTSILQLYNLAEFVEKLFSVNVPWLDQPPASWLTTLVPYLVLAGWSMKQGVVTRRQVGMHLLLIFLCLLLLEPAIENLTLLEHLYALFASVVAWSCYLVIRPLFTEHN